MKKLSILMLCLILKQFSAFNQDQPKVVVFNSPKIDESSLIEEKNILKFGVLDALSGNFSFYYERKVHEDFTIELGLGVTLSDYITSLVNEDLDVFNPNYIPRIGNAFSIGGKYFPSGAVDDFYFGLDFKHKTYKNDRTFNFNDLTYQEERSINVMRLSFGYNYFIDKKILLDLFGGFGIGSIKEMTTAEVTTTDPVTFENVLTYVSTNQSRLVPRVHIGIKVGVVF